MGFGVVMTRVHTWAPPPTSSSILAKLHDFSGPPVVSTVQCEVGFHAELSVKHF